MKLFNKSFLNTEKRQNFSGTFEISTYNSKYFILRGGKDTSKGTYANTSFRENCTHKNDDISSHHKTLYLKYEKQRCTCMRLNVYTDNCLNAVPSYTRQMEYSSEASVFLGSNFSSTQISFTAGDQPVWASVYVAVSRN